MSLFKVIHPVYRIEADNAAEAQRLAEKIIKAGQIRVERVETKQSFFGMLLTGPR